MILINRFRRFLEGVRDSRTVRFLDRLYPKTSYRGDLLAQFAGRSLSPKVVGVITAGALGYTVTVGAAGRRQMAAMPYVEYARNAYEQQRHGRLMSHEYGRGEPTYDTGADGDVALAMWRNRH